MNNIKLNDKQLYWHKRFSDSQELTEIRYQERLATIRRAGLEDEFKAYCEQHKNNSVRLNIVTFLRYKEVIKTIQRRK